MPQSLLARIAQALDRSKIPYMLIGGQAVIFYGEPRFTQDIDLTIGISPDKIGSLIRVISEIGLISEVKNPEEFAKKTMVFPCLSSTETMRVDFIFSDTGFEHAAISRARRVEIDGCPVRIVSLEDLLVFKTIAGRARDLEDVRVLLLKNLSVDEKAVLSNLRLFSDVLEEDLEARFMSIKRKIRT
jgi:predicted nucleotidyltransferase